MINKYRFQNLKRNFSFHLRKIYGFCSVEFRKIQQKWPLLSILFSHSSHIFFFWFFVDSYQETKISAVKFVYFFSTPQNQFYLRIVFVDWLIRNLFSQQKVNINKLTADISLENIWWFGCHKWEYCFKKNQFYGRTRNNWG